MKAALTFTIGKKNVFLDIMELYELDNMFLEKFSDTDEIRHDEKYSEKIKEALESSDVRYLKQKNGSISIILLNDDNTPMQMDINPDGVVNKLVDQKVKMMFKNNYSDTVKGYLIDYYYNNPEYLRDLLKKLYGKLKSDAKEKCSGIELFMDGAYFDAVQNDMFGDCRSLFSDKSINITNPKLYFTNLTALVNSLDFNKIPYIYLHCRRNVINMLEDEKMELKKYGTDPLSETELTRLQMFGKHSMVPRVEQDMMLDSYFAFQVETKEMKETDDLNDRKYEKMKRANSFNQK